MSHKYARYFGCLLAVSLLFSGCANKKAEPAAPAAEPVGIVNESTAPAVEPVPLPMAPKPVASKPKPKTVAKVQPAAEAPAAAPEPAAVPAVVTAPSVASPFEKYTVELVADKSDVAVGGMISLHVHVEADGYPLSGYESHGVQVTFSGLGFVTDAPAVECLRAHPNGSDIYYNVTAMNSGTYRVTANIAVFPTRECKLSSAHKTSAPVVVSVK